MNPQVADLMNSEWGVNGVIIVKDTNAHSSDYRRIESLENSVIASIVLDGITYTSINMSAGSRISGNITTFTLTSGTVAAYKQVTMSARDTELLEMIALGKTFLFLNETSVYPYEITRGRSISALNLDIVNELSVTLTYPDRSTITIPIPKNATYTGIFDEFVKISASGSTSFDIEVRA